MRPADNPFRSTRVDAAPYVCRGPTPEQLIARWEARGRRGTVIGAHGSGKTRLLGELERLLRREGVSPLRLRLDRAPRFEAAALVGAVVLADGHDSLPRWRQRWLLWAGRRSAGMILVTHGATPLPLLHRCEPDRRVLGQVVRELAGEEHRLEAELDVLWRQHRGNMRDVLRALYDRCACS